MFGGAPANVCAHMWVHPKCGKWSPLEDSQGWLSSGMFTRKKAQPCLLAKNGVSFLQRHSGILRGGLLLGMENTSFQWTRAWTGDQPSLSDGAVAWKERPLRGHSSLSARAAIPWSVGWAAPCLPAWCPPPLTCYPGDLHGVMETSTQTPGSSEPTRPPGDGRWTVALALPGRFPCCYLG